MDKVAEMFGKAYNFHVVEDKQHEAIELCKEILKINPNHHNARMLLGITLADYGSADEKIESRNHFIEAIRRSKKIKDILVNKWDEEDPIYQLAIWEWKDNDKLCIAALLFLIDFFFSDKDHSEKYMFDVLTKLNPEMSILINLIVTKIKEEYLIKPIE